MGKGRLIFSILRSSSDPAADDALLAALPSAPLATARAVLETLLVRQNRRGLLGLVASLHQIDDTLHHLLLGESDRLFGVLREAAQSREEQVRLNVLELIRRGCIYRASYLLESAFHDRSPKVRGAAADTLYSLANELLVTSPVSADTPALAAMSPDEMRQVMLDLEAHAEDRRQVTAAIEVGILGFDLHRQERVVETAMWFADDLGQKLWVALTAPGSRIASAASKVLAANLNIRLVPFAISALAYGQFRAQVTAALSTCTDSALLAEWIGQSWRMVQPKVARAFAAMKELACVDGGAADLIHLPPEVQRLVPLWMGATGLTPASRTQSLRAWFQHADRDTQRSAVWILTDWRDAHASTMLRSFAQGEDPEFARIARYELARRRPHDFPLVTVLPSDLAHLDDPVHDTAAPGPMTFDRYWARFDALTEDERHRLGTEMLEHTPLVHGLLTRRLADADTGQRLRALRMVTVLQLAEAFADQVYRLSHDSQPDIRSAAMAALAQLPNATTRRILHNALRDQDPRVQANAVEAVDRSGDPAAATELLPLLASNDNRVRANAVKALLRLGVREAAETLLCMLGHPDRAQRISALWLVEHMGLFALATRIAQMAAADQDTQVRGRARGLVDRLGEPGTNRPAPAKPRPATAQEVRT